VRVEKITTLNASGHEVKIPGGILAHHVSRMLDWIGAAVTETGAVAVMAEGMAVEHAKGAAHAARS